MSGKKVRLHFNDDFLSLLRQQITLYSYDWSKKSIDAEVERAKRDSNSEGYFSAALCFFGVYEGLGNCEDLSERAYIYVMAQESGVVFSDEICPKILVALEKYLKKILDEYNNNIFYFELGIRNPLFSKEKYLHDKSFVEYFKGFEDKPLDKLGTIFEPVEEWWCSIQ